MPEPTIEQLEKALINADKAGDITAAKRLAQAIQGRRSSTAPTAPTPKETTVSTKEKILGFPLTRLAMGAVSPLAGAAQLGSHLIGEGDSVDAFLKDIEKEKQKGMQYWEDKTGLPIGPGTDWLGIAGSALPFAPIATAANGASALAQLARASGLGAVAGASSPVTNDSDYVPEKISQTLEGAGGGAIIPSLGVGYGKLSQGVKDIRNSFNPSQALTEYQRKIIGEPNVGKIVETIEGYKPPIPGTKPTVAEVISSIPEGSPLQSHQRMVASSAGGPSSQFGKRAMENEAAIQEGRKVLEEAMSPVRNAVLSSINESGGVPVSGLQASIYDLSRQPGIRASKAATQSLDQIRDAIHELSRGNLRIDAHDLYEIRKQLGDFINKASKETSSRDKRMLSGIERDIMKIIDEKMESSGGQGWKKYLEEYAKGAKALEQAKNMQKKMYRPSQRTSLRSAKPETSEGPLSHALPKSVRLANEVLKHLGKDIVPEMEQEAAKRYLEPALLAQALKEAPSKNIMDSPTFRQFLAQSGILGSQTATKQQ